MLPRLLSKWRVASRRQAEELVHAGRVRVDGRVVRDVTALVDERATVEVDGRRVGASTAGPTWIALHKPRGVVTTTSDPEGRRTVMDLVERKIPGLAPVGRLDLDSAGLLLLTDDAATAALLLAPERHVAKTYRVKVRGHPGDDVLGRLRTDTLVDDGLVLGPLAVDVAERTEKATWLVVRLREGKNRQIRRRLAHEGHEVLTLIRTAFGPIALGDLRPGAFRELTADEVDALRAAVG
jgi:23S rRNA pseudouridine2605 synthase